MRIIFFITIVVFLFANNCKTYSQTKQLSVNSEISLLTCAPGNEIYSLFGHSAVRVYDTQRGIDVVFNYGTFSFSTPFFYLKFLRGNLDYMLSASRFDTFMEEYRYDKRAVKEQFLNLTLNEKQQVFDFLIDNYKPENRFYRYHFFFDNCATRIRDILPKLFNENIKYSNEIEKENKTFRDLLDIYLDPHPWSQFGINAILGTPTDYIINSQQYMFLPDYLNDAFDNATIIHNGVEEKLVKSEVLLYNPEKQDIENVFLTPALFFWLLLLIACMLTIYELLKNLRTMIFDSIFFTILGLLGLLLIFLWFFTEHTIVEKNWNVIWAFPLHLVFAIMLLRSSKINVLKNYISLMALITLLLLPFWVLLPQRLDYDFIPIILTIVVRGGSYFFAGK